MASKDPAYVRAGFSTPNAYTKAVEQSRTWSRQHSAADNSRWSPAFTPEQKGSYFRAYVSKATGLQAWSGRNQKRWGGSPALHKFLVTDTRRITEAEWQARYVGSD